MSTSIAIWYENRHKKLREHKLSGSELKIELVISELCPPLSSLGMFSSEKTVSKQNFLSFFKIYFI